MSKSRMSIPQSGRVPQFGTHSQAISDGPSKQDNGLIEVAAALFLRLGFERTSMDAVAVAAVVGKATIYVRYGDKSRLFAAVVKNRIQNCLTPLAIAAEVHVSQIGSASVEAAFHELGRDLLRRVQAPETVSLIRCVAAETGRFPHLAALAHAEGWCRIRRSVEALLEHFVAQCQIDAPQIQLAADCYLDLVLGRFYRLILHDVRSDPVVVDYSPVPIDIFLTGLGTREGRGGN